MSSPKTEKKKTLNDVLNHPDRAAAKEMSEELKKRITVFLSDNQGLLVIVADPESDAVVVGFQEHLEAHRLVGKSTDERVAVVRDMLEYDRKDKEVKNSVNQFLMLIDASIHDIAKRLTGKGNKPTKVEKT